VRVLPGQTEATRGRADARCAGGRSQLRSCLLCWPALARHGPHAGLPGLGCADVGSGGAAEAERSGGRGPAGWGCRLPAAGQAEPQGRGAGEAGGVGRPAVGRAGECAVAQTGRRER